MQLIKLLLDLGPLVVFFCAADMPMGQHGCQQRVISYVRLYFPFPNINAVWFWAHSPISAMISCLVIVGFCLVKFWY